MGRQSWAAAVLSRGWESRSFHLSASVMTQEKTQTPRQSNVGDSSVSASGKRKKFIGTMCETHRELGTRIGNKTVPDTFYQGPTRIPA